MGLAQSFLSSGVEHYVGAVWDAPDIDATAEFAAMFYQGLFGGASVGEAMYHARTHCFNSEQLGVCDLTWARYVHFGDPSARLFSN